MNYFMEDTFFKIFWIKFDWPIELLFLCSVIYVIYLVWNLKNNSDIKNKK